MIEVGVEHPFTPPPRSMRLLRWQLQDGFLVRWWFTLDPIRVRCCTGSVPVSGGLSRCRVSAGEIVSEFWELRSIFRAKQACSAAGFRAKSSRSKCSKQTRTASIGECRDRRPAAVFTNDSLRSRLTFRGPRYTRKPDFVMVDMRGLKAALVSCAQARRESVSVLVRRLWPANSDSPSQSLSRSPMPGALARRTCPGQAVNQIDNRRGQAAGCRCAHRTDVA